MECPGGLWLLWLFIDVLGLETEIETMMQTLDISGSLGYMDFFWNIVALYMPKQYIDSFSDILFALYIAKRYLIHSRMDIFLTG